MTSATEELPGVERPKIKAIEIAAEAYTDVRDRRMALTDQEIVARANLITAVIENKDKLTPNAEGEYHYRYDDDMVVVLKLGSPKVKVRHAAEDAPADEE